MAAAANTFTFPRVPVGVYLGSVFRPDVDYVDGDLEERNLGEVGHATIQKMILLALTDQEEAGGFYALQECRVQASPTRFRVPDVCLIPADRIPERIIQEAPLLCVEVLSPRDNLMRMRERCMDFVRMGVPEIWIFDPDAQTAWIMQGEELTERHTGALQLPGTAVAIQVEAIFEAARRKTRRT